MRPWGVLALIVKTTSPPNTHVVPLNIETSKNPWYLLTRAPLTGGLIRAANEETPKAIPKYVPATLRSGITIESAAEAPEMIVPDQKPNTTEYTINAGLDTGLFRQNMIMPVIVPPKDSTFNRPNLSAKTPGMTRPNVEAAFKMAIRYEARVGFMPRDTAYVGIKNKGVKNPKNMKNIAATSRQNSTLAKAEAIKNVVFRGGKRAVTVKHEKASSGVTMNPIIRTDQPKLSDVLFSIFERAIGITTPPIDDPATAAPIAAAMFLSKCCITAAIDGNCKSPMEIPSRTPCASMNCQYLLHRLVIMTENRKLLRE